MKSVIIVVGGTMEKIRFGYACKVMGQEALQFKTCSLKYATDEKLNEVIHHNLNVLKMVLTYNRKHRIHVFRISSDIIPLASHPSFTFNYLKVFQKEFEELAVLAKGMRLSMHPGQYTILNSLSSEVVLHAIADLKYHCQFLDALRLDASNKVILHVGGVYGDKQAAMERFIHQYELLDTEIKKRLVIENDDRYYSIRDVLYISSRTGIPVVFDTLHHEIVHDDTQSVMTWMKKAKATWKAKDGRQKIHYSQQDINKKIGAHSQTINANELFTYLEKYQIQDVDIMLEVKDKNISAIKCTNYLHASKAVLEKEWANYKYLVLERSHSHYLLIREYLKGNNLSSVQFYDWIDTCISMPIITFKNVAQHVWGYYKKEATAYEKKRVLLLIDENNLESYFKLKVVFKRLAIKYKQKYIYDSYYFVYDSSR